MATMRSIFLEWAEGDSLSLQDGPEWHMLTPSRGDVAVVELRDTDIGGEAEDFVACLVLSPYR